MGGGQKKLSARSLGGGKKNCTRGNRTVVRMTVNRSAGESTGKWVGY